MPDPYVATRSPTGWHVTGPNGPVQGATTACEQSSAEEDAARLNEAWRAGVEKCAWLAADAVPTNALENGLTMEAGARMQRRFTIDKLLALKS